MNYFTMHDADQFSFIRVPKELMTNPSYKTLSAESKLLYGVLLDRVSLSRKNNWIDELGRVYIIYTRSDIAEMMGCGAKKITKLFVELKEKDLVEEVRQGLQKPNLIYVGKFLTTVKGNAQFNEVNSSNQSFDLLQKRQNDVSGNVDMTLLDTSKRRTSNTDINNTNISNTEKVENLVIEKRKAVKQTDVINNIQSEFDQVAFYFNHNVFATVSNNPLVDPEVIDEIRMNVLDMYFSSVVMINGERKSKDIIQSALVKLTALQIDNIIYKCGNASDSISDRKAYLQTIIYNEAMEACMYMNRQMGVDSVEIVDWKD